MNDLDARLQRLAAEATKDVTAPDLEVIVRRGRRREHLRKTTGARFETSPFR